ncbi:MULTISPECIES: nitrate- and nitrite sensing domain-containing protein [Rheinheimera]|uniref:Nitrate- and nitrite sensing domain-containing protein n=1 Tax=Rheinheimera marina TaxID=1774958 RepID=A0ABV9JGZ3_9GAMM
MTPVHAFQFLLAAKQAELHQRQRFSFYLELISAICALVHQLQRERGLSNGFLASGSELFRVERNLQCTLVDQSLNALQLKLKALLPESGCFDSAVCHRTSMALLAQQDLTMLRQQISSQAIGTQQSAQAFSRLIHAWHLVVELLAERISDASLQLMLQCLLELSRMKELAGQERAWGNVGFSQGCFSQELSRYIMDLDEEQQQAAERFLQIAPPALVNAWTSQGNSQVSEDLAHLRRMLRQFNGADCMVPAIADVWYQLTTERIDRMQQIILLILTEISTELQQALAEAEGKLTSLQQPAVQQEPESPVSSLLFDPSMPGLHGIAMATPEPERWNPFYKLQQEQATSFAQSAVVQRS